MLVMDRRSFYALPDVEIPDVEIYKGNPVDHKSLPL